MLDKEVLKKIRNRWVLLFMFAITLPFAVVLEDSTRGTGFADNWQAAVALILTGLIGLYLALYSWEK